MMFTQVLGSAVVAALVAVLVSRLVARTTPPLAPVQIWRKDGEAVLPRYMTKGAAAFDLSTLTEVTLQPGEIKLVPTGLVIAAPEGTFLALVARSSLARRGLKLANAFGVVDSDYCGSNDEVKVMLHNFTDQPVTIQAHERVAQGLILPAQHYPLIEVMQPVRGDDRGGFGSTGK